MPKAKSNGPSVLTANDLLSGAIVYWTGSAWSRSILNAVRARDEAARADLTDVGAAAEAKNLVVGAYLVALDDAGERPVALRERQRLAGPFATLDAA